MAVVTREHLVSGNPAFRLRTDWGAENIISIIIYYYY